MADPSGVTEADLRAKLIEKLEATHVDIEDMSGTFELHTPRNLII